MEDLSEQIARLLSSPEAMDAVKDLAEMLGTDAPDDPPGEKSAASEPETGFSGSMPDLSLLMRLMPLLARVNADDDSTRLLAALRPHLSGERQAKLDRAARFLRVFRLMPLLTEQGLFGGGE